mmetsp:Transcript_21119/g.45860  ORF Transcript_21119/g.45860 Transcript_21119/m.45860 type:complete len:302 (+) Transcript_21119:57-962(+)
MSSDRSSSSSIVNWSLLESPAVIQQCRQSLQSNGIMTIPNFATAAGITALKSEILSCPYNESTQHYTSYQDQGDLANYPPTHPRNHKVHSSASFVGRKSLHTTQHRHCINLYNDARLSTFLSAVVASPKQLYQSKDENGSVYSYRIESHHDPPWHFDESHYTAILYLQNSQGGGAFEYVPWCRKTKSVDDVDGHDVIRKVVMGGEQQKSIDIAIMADDDDDDDSDNKSKLEVQQIRPERGMLLFFSGVHTFHRVAKVTGPVARVGLVFTYSENENFCNSEDVKGSNEWDPADSTKILQDGH